MAESLGSRYVLQEVLGRGAMGQVFSGSIRSTGEQVAIKVLRPELVSDPEVVARFVQERTIGTAAVTATGSGGQLLVQLANFPVGAATYYCHSGTGYPTGNTVNHVSVDTTPANENLGALCSGWGTFWIGFQTADGSKFYNNQVTLG